MVDIFNVYEVTPSVERFFNPHSDFLYDWHGYSALPESALERMISKPKISRYRAAWSVASQAKTSNCPVVVSHMPVMSAAVGYALAANRLNTPHVAFAFNYTTLPVGFRFKYHRHGLSGVDHFFCFSRYELGLYSNFFDFPSERFSYIPWTQNLPPLSDRVPDIFGGSRYLSALGGEGRDYKLLMDAATRTNLPILIIGRRHSVAGLSVPRNVVFMSDLPLDQAWGLVRKSVGLVLPLKSDKTCCGQVTLVSALMLGIPLVVTDSVALHDYIHDATSILKVAAGDVLSLSEALEQIYEDAVVLGSIAQSNSPEYIKRFSRRNWDKVMNQKIHEIIERSD